MFIQIFIYQKYLIYKKNICKKKVIFHKKKDRIFCLQSHINSYVSSLTIKNSLPPLLPCQVCNQDTYFIAWKITLFHHSNSDGQRSHCFNTYHPNPLDCHYMYSIFTSSFMKELFLASLLLMLMGSTVLVVVRKSTIWQTRSQLVAKEVAPI